VVLGLCFVTLSAVLMARSLGLGPDEDAATLRARATLCEVMAVHGSQAVAKGRPADFEAALQAVARRNPEILSAAVRRNDGRLLCTVNEHERFWRKNMSDAEPGTQTHVPIVKGADVWGSLEVRFHCLQQRRLLLFPEPRAAPARSVEGDSAASP
jgi:hypothetical protein